MRTAGNYSGMLDIFVAFHPIAMLYRVVQLLVEDLCDLAENPRIHNCVHVTAMHMLQFCCLRRDWPTSTPIRVIKVIFNSTLSESLVIRRCGYTLMRIILELNKVRSLKASKPLYELC